jgi:hypothetical protein
MGVGLLWAKFEDEELVHNRSLDISKKKKKNRSLDLYASI